MTTEHQDVLRKLEAMIEKLENLSVQQQTADPKRQKVVDELMTEAQDAVEEIVRWQRRRDDESQLVAVIEAIDKNTETFLKAIDKNTKTTNELLVVSAARLSQIEQASRAGRTAFEVDPDILAEACFPKAQLAGVEGTEGPGPLFKDAPTVTIPTGLEVLATAVNNADHTRVRDVLTTRTDRHARQGVMTDVPTASTPRLPRLPRRRRRTWPSTRRRPSSGSTRSSSRGSSRRSGRRRNANSAQRHPDGARDPRRRPAAGSRTGLGHPRPLLQCVVITGSPTGRPVHADIHACRVDGAVTTAAIDLQRAARHHASRNGSRTGVKHRQRGGVTGGPLPDKPVSSGIPERTRPAEHHRLADRDRDRRLTGGTTPAIQIVANGAVYPPGLWDHLIYAYMVENTRVYEIFRRVLEEYAYGERLGVPPTRGNAGCARPSSSSTTTRRRSRSIR